GYRRVGILDLHAILSEQMRDARQRLRERGRRGTHADLRATSDAEALAIGAAVLCRPPRKRVLASCTLWHVLVRDDPCLVLVLDELGLVVGKVRPVVDGSVEDGAPPLGREGLDVPALGATRAIDNGPEMNRALAFGTAHMHRDRDRHERRG